MAKRGDNSEESETAQPDQEANSSGVPMAAVHPAMVRVSDPRYHEAGEWKGNTRWECDNCPFDSLSEQTMKTHAATHMVKTQSDAAVAAEAAEPASGESKTKTKE